MEEPTMLGETETVPPGRGLVVTQPGSVPAALSAGADVTDLLRIAVEKDISVEKLERLVDLRIRMEERAAEAAMAEALARFQAECPPLPKSKHINYVTKTGAKVDYHFAPLPEIARIVRPVLRACGLSYSWDSSVTGGAVRVACTLRHALGATRTANFECAADGAGSPTMNSAQKAGSALSYGQRYSLIQVLGLTTAEDDVDGEAPDVAREPITQAEADELDSLMDELEINKAKLLAVLGVESLAALPAAQYDIARRLIEGKRRA